MKILPRSECAILPLVLKKKWFDEIRLGGKREEFLGHIMEELGATNQHNGQFLTPVDVSSLMGDIVAEEPRDEVIRLHDPCCGAGVLVLEGAERFMKHGWEQRNIFVDAGDVDGHACDMCYVQLSLLGYAGVVRHQNALSREYYGTTPIRYTPGFYMHCFPMRLGMGANREQGDTETANGHAPSGPEGAPSSNETGKPVQMELELN